MGIFSNYNKNSTSLNEFYISLLEQINQNELSWNDQPITEDVKEELAYVDNIISSLPETERWFLGPRWFYYNSQYRFIYIDDDNKPIGFIEVRIIKKRCNLNVAVNPSYRKKGMAHKLISKALEDVQYILIGSKIFVAVINPLNKQSISLVKEFGFKQVQKLENGYLVFELEDKHTIREGMNNMGIYSNKATYIQELKIDGKKVKNDDEDLGLDSDETNKPKDNTDPPTNTDTTNKDEEDYTIPNDNEPNKEEEPPTNAKPDDEEDYKIPDDEPDNENPSSNDASTEDETGGSDEKTNDEDLNIEDPDNPDDGTEGEMGDNSDGETDPNSEIQSLEDNLFKDLSPEQMAIKQIELKQQYIDLFDSISDIVSRVNKITKTTDNTNVIEFVTNKMIELKDLVHYYLNNTYNTKTYIENTMNYQQYILMLNAINRMLKEIIPKTGESN